VGDFSELREIFMNRNRSGFEIPPFVRKGLIKRLRMIKTIEREWTKSLRFRRWVKRVILASSEILRNRKTGWKRENSKKNFSLFQLFALLSVSVRAVLVSRMIPFASSLVFLAVSTSSFC